MTLDIISKALKSEDETGFDEWISSYEEQLSVFFYNLDATNLQDSKFDDFYLNNIVASNAYKHYHSSRKKSSQFDFFLNLVSIAAEKMAVIGNPIIIQNLLIDLPDGPNKIRLQALNEFILVDDIRIGYFQRFPLVLDRLNDSLTLFENGDIRKVLDILIYFYRKAKGSFESKDLPLNLQMLKNLFLNKDLSTSYPFLRHQVILDLIANDDLFSIESEKVERKCLLPSLVIKNLFNTFNSDFFNHPNIDSDNNNLWGLTSLEILDTVLIRGRGDFTSAFGMITAKDKVMLYCFYNLKKHFFTSYAVFQTVLDTLSHIFDYEEYVPVFIDLGCGPMTSGLALADIVNSTLGRPITVNYIGVDISQPMIDKAKTFESLSIFSLNCCFKYFKNWNDITTSELAEVSGRNNPVLFNASYLFASDSICPEDLANYVNNIRKHYDNVYFIFQNPDREDRNTKYEIFKSKISFQTLVSITENIPYKSASNLASEDVYYEILKL